MDMVPLRREGRASSLATPARLLAAAAAGPLGAPACYHHNSQALQKSHKPFVLSLLPFRRAGLQEGPRRRRCLLVPARGQHRGAASSDLWRGKLGPHAGTTRAPWVGSPTCLVAESARPRGGAPIRPRGHGLGGSLGHLRAVPPSGGAVAADSAVRRGRRSARRCPGTRLLFSCGVVFFPSFLAVLDPCSTYPGARGPVPWEVDVPPAGEGHLGPAPAAEGLARPCQRAFISVEHGGGGPSPSLC